MATQTISSLPLITSGSVDTATDVIPIVDTSTSCTKKITVCDLLSLGGGIMDVGTGAGSTLRVDNSNTASGKYSAVLSGKENCSQGIGSVIVGGGNVCPPLALCPGNTITNAGDISFIGGGSGNTISCYGAVIVGGKNNLASGKHSTVSGGFCNTSSGNYSTTGGGRFNQSTFTHTTVGGGINNTASGYRATVSGGYCNTSVGNTATVTGGRANTASGKYSIVLSGYSNTASGTYSVVSGYNNTASNYFTIVSGGCGNTASGYASAILGGRNNSTNSCNCTMIVGDSITANRACTTFVNNLSIMTIPTSAAGLPTGAVWRCTADDTLRIVP
jgi:hypothetical protein